MNKILVSGKVEGIVLKSNDPINFLGTVDKKTGIISDKNHTLFEKSLKNSILVFPSGIGSSVGAYTIYSIKSNNTAPIAMICKKADLTVATGCTNSIKGAFYLKNSNGVGVNLKSLTEIVEDETR